MLQLSKYLRKWRKRRSRKSAQEPRPIAAFVSYPKSGRTWLRVIFDELGVPLKYTHDGAGASKRRTFLEGHHCRKDRYKKWRVIFLARDPRDTIVSAYFHQKFRMSDYDGDISQFVRDPCRGIEKIVLYNLTWLEDGPQMPAFLPISYEEMSADGFGVVRKVTGFLGRDFSDAEIESVIANNTFEKMHQREAGDEYRRTYDWEISPGDPRNLESYKTRRGKSGGFVDYLSSDDISFCNDVLKRHDYFERAAAAARPSAVSS